MITKGYLLAKKYNLSSVEMLGVMQRLEIDKTVISGLTSAERNAICKYCETGEIDQALIDEERMIKERKKQENSTDWGDIAKTAYFTFKIFGG